MPPCVCVGGVSRDKQWEGGGSLQRLEVAQAIECAISQVSHIVVGESPAHRARCIHADTTASMDLQHLQVGQCSQ